MSFNGVFRAFGLVLFIVFVLVLFIYTLLPTSGYPEPLPGSLQSNEPADVETPLRRGFYTDLSREVVITHYKESFSKVDIFGKSLQIPVVRLNYPPEEAQTLIRDQTRSTFLEEIVQPFRESIFINGNEPKEDKDAIVVGGKRWRQKVIVRYVPSAPVWRFVTSFLAVLGTYIVVRGWFVTFKKLSKK